jgi:LemA protein
MTVAAIVLGGLVLVVVVWFMATYNGFVRMRNAVKNAWSQIDVQLKRRHDLIPNLVETARGYMKHERETLESVTQARNVAANAAQGGSVGERARAESALGGALGRLLVVMENYPDLKANQNFLSLQEELASTENRIGFARQHYNDSVMHYNTRIQVIPANMVAGMCNFTAEEFFELEDESAREAPKVQF